MNSSMEGTKRRRKRIKLSGVSKDVNQIQKDSFSQEKGEPTNPINEDLPSSSTKEPELPSSSTKQPEPPSSSPNEPGPPSSSLKEPEMPSSSSEKPELDLKQKGTTYKDELDKIGIPHWRHASELEEGERKWNTLSEAEKDAKRMELRDWKLKWMNQLWKRVVQARQSEKIIPDPASTSVMGENISSCSRKPELPSSSTKEPELDLKTGTFKEELDKAEIRLWERASELEQAEIIWNTLSDAEKRLRMQTLKKMNEQMMRVMQAPQSEMVIPAPEPEPTEVMGEKISSCSKEPELPSSSTKEPELELNGKGTTIIDELDKIGMEILQSQFEQLERKCKTFCEAEKRLRIQKWKTFSEAEKRLKIQEWKEKNEQGKMVIPPAAPQSEMVIPPLAPAPAPEPTNVNVMGGKISSCSRTSVPTQPPNLKRKASSSIGNKPGDGDSVPLNKLVRKGFFNSEVFKYMQECDRRTAAAAGERTEPYGVNEVNEQFIPPPQRRVAEVVPPLQNNIIPGRVQQPPGKMSSRDQMIPARDAEMRQFRVSASKPALGNDAERSQFRVPTSRPPTSETSAERTQFRVPANRPPASETFVDRTQFRVPTSRLPALETSAERTQFKVPASRPPTLQTFAESSQFRVPASRPPAPERAAERTQFMVPASRPPTFKRFAEGAQPMVPASRPPAPERAAERTQFMVPASRPPTFKRFAEGTQPMVPASRPPAPERAAQRTQFMASSSRPFAEGTQPTVPTSRPPAPERAAKRTQFMVPASRPPTFKRFAEGTQPTVPASRPPAPERAAQRTQFIASSSRPFAEGTQPKVPASRPPALERAAERTQFMVSSSRPSAFKKFVPASGRPALEKSAERTQCMVPASTPSTFERFVEETAQFRVLANRPPAPERVAERTPQVMVPDIRPAMTLTEQFVRAREMEVERSTAVITDMNGGPEIVNEDGKAETEDSEVSCELTLGSKPATKKSEEMLGMGSKQAAKKREEESGNGKKDDEDMQVDGLDLTLRL